MRFVRRRARTSSEVAEELRLSGVTNDIADQVMADDLGLNRTDTRCLDIIERLDGVSAGRLASEAGLSTGAVTTVLDRLERAGYARRVQDPGDRRRVLVELTPAGAARAAGALRAARRRHHATTRGVHDRRGQPRTRLHARQPAPQRGPRGARARTPEVRSGGRGGLVALGPLVLPLGLREHAHEQLGERDPHHDRLLERHDQRRRRAGRRAASGPRCGPSRRRTCRARSGANVSSDAEQADERSSSTPCRATGPRPPSRSRMRIGESRCHQYRSPAAAKREVLEDVDAGVLERGVVERGDVPEPHRADVGDDAERRVAERAGRRSSRWMRRVTGRRMTFVSAEREQDRREVGSSRCWTMCIDEELLAEAVDRRDQRDEQQRDARRPTTRSAPAARGARRRPRRADVAPARAVDRRA